MSAVLWIRSAQLALWAESAATALVRAFSALTRSSVEVAERAQATAFSTSSASKAVSAETHWRDAVSRLSVRAWRSCSWASTWAHAVVQRRSSCMRLL